MGTTSTGLRYPEPSEPVNQGAANIKNLADDVNGRFVVQYQILGAAQINLPAGGTLGYIGGLTVPAATFTRSLTVTFRGVCTAMAGASWGDLQLMLNNAMVSRARINNNPGNPQGTYLYRQAAGAVSTWAVNVNSSVASTWAPEPNFAGILITAHPTV